MDDVAVYGYITASKMKIVLALLLSDTVIKDVEVVNVSAHNLFLLTIHDLLYSLITLPYTSPRPVNESVPHGIPMCSREPLPQITRALRRGQ
jgi:hypothetical protein